MKRETSIEVKNLSIYGLNILDQSLFDLFKSPKKMPILENVNFEAKKGDRIGILGLNGSGKSSLLRVICGNYPPHKGTVKVHGTILSMLAAGAGIDPNLSGRDNIRLLFIYNDKFDEYSQDIEDKIIDYAELRDYIDNPVSQYSSGMVARFTFACGLFQHGNILIMDEIFATGDKGFIDKAIHSMCKKWDEVDISIIVSHEFSEIERLCKTAYIMDKGRVIDYGDVKDIEKEYKKIIQNHKICSKTY